MHTARGAFGDAEDGGSRVIGGESVVSVVRDGCKGRAVVVGWRIEGEK